MSNSQLSTTIDLNAVNAPVASDPAVPETFEQLQRWFIHIPGFLHKSLAKIIEHAPRDTFYAPDYTPENPAPWVSWLWHRIVDRKFLYQPKNCFWATRSGMVYSCDWGGHENLLSTMGVGCWEAEQAGWIRVSGTSAPSSIQGRCRPTEQQMRQLKKYGADVYIDSRHDFWMQLTPPEDMPVIDRYEF